MALEWNNSYDTGIPIIDEQHKELFKITSNLLILWSKSDTTDQLDTIKNDLSSLIKYTKYHFQTEETLLKKYNYPEFDEHIQEHQEFINFIMAQNPEGDLAHQYKVIEEVLTYLAKWITHHISEVDYKYRECLLSNLK